MDRAEALAVLHEILEALQESISMNSVSLDDSVISTPKKGYSIKMNCILDSISKRSLENVLHKHKLFMQESKEFIIIQSQ